MSSPAMLLALIAAFVVVVVIARLYSSRQRGQTQPRSGQLRERYGSEYDRTLAEAGDARKAERELAAREKRVSSFHIKPLDPEDGRRFSAEWQAMKASFVDDPSAAFGTAEALVGQAMDARGYPAGDYAQRAADVSVDHSKALESYRSAHEVSIRNAMGEADTEDLRKAVLNDHDLFAELTEPQAATAAAPSEPASPLAPSTPLGPDAQEVAATTS
jgi:hypothetical protein